MVMLSALVWVKNSLRRSSRGLFLLTVSPTISASVYWNCFVYLLVGSSVKHKGLSPDKFTYLILTKLGKYAGQCNAGDGHLLIWQIVKEMLEISCTLCGRRRLAHWVAFQVERLEWTCRCHTDQSWWQHAQQIEWTWPGCKRFPSLDSVRKYVCTYTHKWWSLLSAISLHRYWNNWVTPTCMCMVQAKLHFHCYQQI